MRQFKNTQVRNSQARAGLKRSTLLLLIVGVALGLWMVLRSPPAPPPAVLHPTPRRLAQAETHLAGLDRAAPGLGPRTLRLSEDDLNVYLAGSRPARKLLAAHGVQAVQLVLREPADVIVHATVRVHNHAQNIQVSGALAPDTKTGLRFTADAARVGSFPLPAPVVTAEANALAAHFSDQFQRRLALSVQSVRVQKKDLVIVGLPISIPTAAASPQSKSPGRR